MGMRIPRTEQSLPLLQHNYVANLNDEAELAGSAASMVSCDAGGDLSSSCEKASDTDFLY